jgi:hypothetical protein
MPDPTTVQICFADLQPAIVGRSKANPPQNLSCAASILARCARLLTWTVANMNPCRYGRVSEPNFSYKRGAN